MILFRKKRVYVLICAFNYVLFVNSVWMNQSVICWNVANQSNAVAFEHQSAYVPPCVLLQVDLDSLIEHRVHELVEADDLALDAQVVVLVEPHFHAALRLEILENHELHTTKHKQTKVRNSNQLTSKAARKNKLALKTDWFWLEILLRWLFSVFISFSAVFGS